MGCVGINQYLLGSSCRQNRSFFKNNNIAYKKSGCIGCICNIVELFITSINQTLARVRLWIRKHRQPLSFVFLKPFCNQILGCLALWLRSFGLGLKGVGANSSISLLGEFVSFTRLKRIPAFPVMIML